MTGTPKPLTLGPFTPGMNNRRPDFKLKKVDNTGSSDFLRSAVNADITAEGTVRRRPGYALALSGSDCHSLWSTFDGLTAFFVDYATLYRVTGTHLAPTKTVLRTGMTPGRLVSYHEANGSVYWTNGVEIGRIDATGTYPNGVPMLTVTPTATAGTGGALPAGDYLVCFTQHNADGEESGSTVPQQVMIPSDGGKLDIAGLPSVFASGITALSIYTTAPNDGTLLRSRVLTDAVASYTIANINALGARCTTLLLMPMPAGSIMRELNGRLLVASGSTLFYSEPYAYGLTNPARNYVMFPAPITMIEPCQNGFYLAADQTYWIAGDIATATLDPVLPYGAIPNSSGTSLDENLCFWMGLRGMCQGDQDGKVTALQEANVITDDARTGAFLYRKHDGMRQALGGLFGTGVATGVSAASFIDAEIIRKATTL